MNGLLEDQMVFNQFSLKMLCSPLCHPLAFIFQLLFDDGCLPPVRRKALITAIHKKVDSSLPSIYRPIP